MARRVLSPGRAVAVVATLFVMTAILGAYTGYAAIARAQDPYAGLDLFAHVLTRVETSYVDEVPNDRLVAAAIRGITEELDPHSRWLSPQEHQALQDDTEGAYEGIGVEVDVVAEGARVDRVLPNGPASIAGIQPGDLLLTVNGSPLAGRSLDDISLVMKGPRGEGVLLGVVRAGWPSPRDVRVVRDRVYTPSIEGELFNGDVAWVRLTQFQTGAAADLNAELRRLTELLPPPPPTGRLPLQPTETRLGGIILDLRDNPGGLLDEAVAVADLFLDDGVIVSTRGRGTSTQDYRATVGGVAATIPVAVLINEKSASASEIVSGALQDTARATLVGSHTYGKGSVQTVYGYRDGSALKLTVARYYTPSGKPVAPNEGRQPDIAVTLDATPSPAAELRDKLQAQRGLPERDRSELIALLDRVPPAAAEVPTVPWALHGAERLAADAPLRKAIEVVRARR
jgi:carboxyl-terminal processing protease